MRKARTVPANRVLNVPGFPVAMIRGMRTYDSKVSGIKQPDMVKEADAKLVGHAVKPEL